MYIGIRKIILVANFVEGFPLSNLTVCAKYHLGSSLARSGNDAHGQDSASPEVRGRQLGGLGLVLFFKFEIGIFHTMYVCTYLASSLIVCKVRLPCASHNDHT